MLEAAAADTVAAAATLPVDVVVAAAAAAVVTRACLHQPAGMAAPAAAAAAGPALWPCCCPALLTGLEPVVLRCSQGNHCPHIVHVPEVSVGIRVWLAYDRASVWVSPVVHGCQWLPAASAGLPLPQQSCRALD